MLITDSALEVINSVGLLVYAFYKELWAPYVQEKGKNAATKEDVAEITRQVESVKVEFEKAIETNRVDLQLRAALTGAYELKCLEALTTINNLLVEVTLYCWKCLADRSPDEHYVWSTVDDLDSSHGFHYYRVAVDKAALVHGLYLSPSATVALRDLAGQLGLLAHMELQLLAEVVDPGVEESAVAGYTKGLDAVEACRRLLAAELGIHRPIR